MKDIAPELLSRIQRGVTTLCTCISIRRRDGVTYYFTDHDEPVPYGGVSYVPYNSFARTAIDGTSDLDVSGMELRGILSSAAVARADIAAGKFNFAEVEVAILDYETPDIGRAVMRTGWLGEIIMNEDDTFQAEVRGLSQVYTYRIGEAYTPECRADLGDSRCRVPVAPVEWEPGMLVRRGDHVIYKIGSAIDYVNLSFENGSFEDDTPVTPRRAPTGWTTYGPTDARWDFRSSTNGLDNAKLGSRFVVHVNSGGLTSAEIGMYQQMNLEAQGVDLDAIDTGLCRLTSSVWIAATNGKTRGRFRISTQDVNGVETPLYDSGVRETREDLWTQDTGCKDIIIPAGARTLKFDLSGSKRTSSPTGVAFDGIAGAINYPDGTWGSADEYGNVAYRAQNPGTTGATAPAFTTLIGAEFTDNDITWVTVQGVNTTGYVGSVAASNITFTPSALAGAAGRYDGGLLTWETGQNAGQSQEVKTWAGGRITFFQRPFFAMKSGDRFTIRPGCDKRRSTCGDTFDNIFNFRGEPDVPGQDEYMKTPNAQAG